ncbi:MAG TPA: hypothetical protein PK718_06645 [Candidatus Methanofastidiosa archaeon]|nr:hypothetical protein [Candidatus Methanofastidiosa archaeon]HPR42207.1 hypothetical protein [Candidatus Methanofastidiosa archaeon]
MEKGKIVRCPYCGASDVDETHGEFRCRYCSTVFTPPKDGPDLALKERPLFTCAGCSKSYYAEEWEQYSRISLQTSRSPVAKKTAVNYEMYYCPRCHDFLCLKCVEKGRFNRITCAKCGKSPERVSGSFVVSDLKEVPGMFRHVHTKYVKKV